VVAVVVVVAIVVVVAAVVVISAGLDLIAMLVGVALGVMFVPVVAHVAADALCFASAAANLVLIEVGAAKLFSKACSVSAAPCCRKMINERVAQHPSPPSPLSAITPLLQTSPSSNLPLLQTSPSSNLPLLQPPPPPTSPSSNPPSSNLPDSYTFGIHGSKLVCGIAPGRSRIER
jgi:hypothetical protein